MNSIWNNNIKLFQKRFPQLFELIKKDEEFYSKLAGTEKQDELYSFWKITQTKTNLPTAEENGLKLHSAYNPLRESQSLIESKKEELGKAEAIVFTGIGLGYTALECAKLYPEKQYLIVEPDIPHFLSALLLVDFSTLFNCDKLILALSCPPEQLITLINQHSLENTVIFSVKAHETHAETYFSNTHELIKRNLEKEKINKATLKKFEKRWRTNCRKNAHFLKTLDGVDSLENSFSGIPFLLIAAGPSLEQFLPHLKELKKRTKIVCVDTALKAVLRAEIQPDYIILTDPQYWAYRHIAGLSSPESTLITEIAAYPAVFKFNCKKIILCDSQVPMAKEYGYIPKGNLGAGGSVASAAFNFCVLCGAKEIFLCGLDLSFPKNQTHIKGSTFEENVHRTSFKNETAETKSLPLLFNGNAVPAENYNGETVLTDKKMKMFAWWFESRIAELNQIKVYTLSPSGLKIPGISPFSAEKILNFPILP